MGFRDESNRAHNRERNTKTIATFSEFCGEATPGQTIWGHKFLEGGTVEDLNIFVDRLIETRKFSITIKRTRKDDSLVEITRDLEVGDNVFYDQSVSKGDRIIIISEDIEGQDTTPKARDIFITFKLKK